MNKVSISVLTAALALAISAAAPSSARASPALECKLDFTLTTWSVIYKHAEGEGMVNCANGQSMPVTIRAKGAGLTLGKSKIEDGNGQFSDVHDIRDIPGSYAQAEAHAGMVKSAGASVLTKGEVSLALAGKGEGVNLGIDVAKFTIEPLDRPRKR